MGPIRASQVPCGGVRGENGCWPREPIESRIRAGAMRRELTQADGSRLAHPVVETIPLTRYGDAEQGLSRVVPVVLWLSLQDCELPRVRAQRCEPVDDLCRVGLEVVTRHGGGAREGDGVCIHHDVAYPSVCGQPLGQREQQAPAR